MRMALQNGIAPIGLVSFSMGTPDGSEQRGVTSRSEMKLIQTMAGNESKQGKHVHRRGNLMKVHSVPACNKTI